MVVVYAAALIAMGLAVYWMAGSDCGERIAIGTVWLLAGC
jgi:hypothetical protein